VVLKPYCKATTKLQASLISKTSFLGSRIFFRVCIRRQRSKKSQQNWRESFSENMEDAGLVNRVLNRNGKNLKDKMQQKYRSNKWR